MTLLPSKQLGAEAETFAQNYLIEQGLQLIARNFSCKLGEIDLIMRDSDQMVFIEVRYRKQIGYGSSQESVNYFKQQKLIKAASYYLQTQGLYNSQSCRFDMVALAKQANGFKLEWIKDAFQVS
jgi:putative endonuclease